MPLRYRALPSEIDRRIQHRVSLHLFILPDARRGGGVGRSTKRSYGRSRQARDDVGLISEQKVTEHLFPRTHSSMPFMVAADATNLQS